MSKAGIALVGYGTIGAGVIEILQDEAELIFRRSGLKLELLYVVDTDTTSPRRVSVRNAKLISDYKAALADPEVSIVVELIGGTGIAAKIVREALEAGKSVVTANKALVAEKGADLFALAAERRVALLFEASVAGGIPIIRTLADALSGDRIESIHGIVNGTTNFILTKMTEEGWDFPSALKRAQELGFAEADPTKDINGYDAANKAAILASLAFNCPVDFSKVPMEGIEGIDAEDVRIAGELGYVVKLLALAKRDSDGSIEVRVNPTLVPKDELLASVRNEFNAVLVRSHYLGDSMYYGRGAGSQPTATAVVADILDIARMSSSPASMSRYAAFQSPPLKPLGKIESRYYLRFMVRDRAGVLAAIAGIFARKDISIASVMQPERSADGHVPIIMTTHHAIEEKLGAALEEIEKEDFCMGRGVKLRIL